MTGMGIKKIKVKAPAKINLTLKVGSVRPDGFHPIESIMSAINLFDYIDIETSNRSDISSEKTPACSFVKISSNSNEIPNDSSNIAYKAAELFLKETKISDNINIYLYRKKYSRLCRTCRRFNRCKRGYLGAE